MSNLNSFADEADELVEVAHIVAQIGEQRLLVCARAHGAEAGVQSVVELEHAVRVDLVGDGHEAAHRVEQIARRRAHQLAFVRRERIGRELSRGSLHLLTVDHQSVHLDTQTAVGRAVLVRYGAALRDKLVDGLGYELL